MAQKTRAKAEEEELSPEQLKKRLDNLDQRLDAIDTMVTALAERMMNRPISVEVTCPSCGRIIEIAMVGNEKMMR
ncbi:MAG: hypothetical protein DRI26_07105 [Chloroflexi bacterium]|nr:MAG: hypothetical protein DRI26_07105 [Chloroflexota bacterium]